MRFNKEKTTRKVFLIDNEEVNEEAFFTSLKEAAANEYGETAFDSYLNDNYNNIEIEGYYYDPIDVLEAMVDYSSAYKEWLESKTQEILDDFNEGLPRRFIGVNFFEIREIEEARINIELTNEEANKLFIVLVPNKSVAGYSRMGEMAKNFLQMLYDFSEIEE